MATQALYRKWRSQTFEEIIGQAHITQTLQNAIETKRVGHAYLFTGPRGTGKTSTARILAKAVNCTGEGTPPCNQCAICEAVREGRLMDLIEIDAASNTSVDDIRELRDKVDFRPGLAEMKFYIIDEVHMLSKSAFNALLKTLEEPPPHVIFVLATTEPERIPATITSRCQRFDFRRISAEEVANWLHHICEEEKIDAEREALLLIARQGGGSMRDSISLLDQLTTYGDEGITLTLVRTVLGTADNQATQTLVSHLINNDVSAGLAFINSVIQDGIDPRQFTYQILEYMRGLLLVKYDNGQQFLNLPEEVIETMRPQAEGLSAPRLLNIIERFNTAIQAFRSSAGEVAIPQLPLELAFVETASSEVIMASSSSEPVKAADATPQPSNSSPTPKVQPKPTTSRPPQNAAPSSPVPTPPSTPTETEQPITVAGQSSSMSLETVQAQWGAIGTTLKQQNKSMAQALLNSGQVIQVQGEKIIFSLPSEILKERSEKQREAIQGALDAVFGPSTSIEFTVGQLPPPEHTSQLSDSATPEASDAEKKKNIEQDPLIKSALELGGKVKGIHPIDEI